jgi:hypothetical protein
MSDEIKYPWQQPVLEAFMASRDSLPVKISVAERAIAARLRDRQQQTDISERIALDDALRMLQILIAETAPKPSPETGRPRPETGTNRKDIA